MSTSVNAFSQNSYHTLTPPLSPPSTSQYHECTICKASYRTKAGLTRHKTTVRKYNVQREGLYVLPSEAITEFKAYLVHIIQNKLKVHFSGLGR